jgi:hypothetical protein
LPWTDLALRGESLGAHRPDLWRTLAGLGATHVVVHTARLAAMPAGAAALTSLREARSGDRIASFSDAEVYRVSQQPTPAPSVAELRRELVTASAGGTLDGRCVEVGPGVPPLVLYVPRSRNIAALAFVAETPIGDIDDALLVELSASLGAFRPAEHQPLLSTSIAEYVRRPTPLLWTHAVLAPADGPFVRLSSRRDRRLRLCEIGVMAPAASAVEIVRFSRDGLRLGAHAAASTAALASDGDPHTRWHSQAPQAGSEWLEVDLGELRLVQAVVLDLGQTAYDYGRRLALDCPASAAAEHSGFELDGRDALFDRPRPVQILWLPQARRCRSLRIRQTGQASSNHWSVAELEVYGHGGS